MVTIRNDIESNGSANRPDGNGAVAASVDGVKNINHLANGSRRSTMMDLKSKKFNRKCVGFLALIVCVGVCFGIGMLFLYGHLVDRLNESAIAGTMWHDKNGSPVKVAPSFANDVTATTISTMTTSMSTDIHSTPVMVPTTRASLYDASTSSMPPRFVFSTTHKPDDAFDLDSKQLPKKEFGEQFPKIGQRIETSSESNRVRYYDEDDGEGSGESSGYGSGNDYENDQPYDGSGSRN